MVRLALAGGGHVPLHTQIRAQLRHLITTGQLRAGARLPAARRLADDLSINWHTVLQASRVLGRDGYVVARHGQGTIVADAVPGPPAAQDDPGLRARLDDLIR